LSSGPAINVTSLPFALTSVTVLAAASMAVILAWTVTCADGGIAFDRTGFCAVAGVDQTNVETPTIIIMVVATSEIGADFSMHSLPCFEFGKAG
jgi:hypothetical protein